MPGGLQPPLEVVLSWPPSNSINPESRGDGLVILEAVLLALCYLVVSLRLYARACQGNNYGIDDGMIVFSLLPLTGAGTCVILAYTQYGYGKHVWDTSTSQHIASRKAIIAFHTTYTLTTGFTKLSVLLFYRRLAVGTLSRSFKYLLYTAQASVVGFMVAFLIAIWTSCQPLNAFWNLVNLTWRTEQAGKYHCLSEGATIVSGSVISVVQDFIACALPMILFWKLQIPKKKKIALMAIFSVGYILCICAILRVHYTIVLYQKTYDVTWAAHPVWITAVLESHLSILCASAPALHYFFRKALASSSVASRLRTIFHSPRNGEDDDQKTLHPRSVAFDGPTGDRAEHLDARKSPELELDELRLGAGNSKFAAYNAPEKTWLED